MSGALQEGISFHKQGRHERAEKKYLEAMAENFDSRDALYLLGTIMLQKKVYGLAAQLLLRAIHVDKDHFESWNNLGNCHKAINDDVNALRCYEKALSIKGRDEKEYADIYCNLSTIYVNAGNPKEGIPQAKKALILCPDHADAAWNLALLQLETGDFANGFDSYEAGFRTNNRLFRNYGPKVEPWKGEKGKKIVVWGEQGIGDEILFASMIPDLIAISKHVIIECHPRMEKIFKESFPQCSVYGTRKDEWVAWPKDHKDLEAKVAMGDLGRFFRRSLSDFPDRQRYLSVPSERVEHYRAKLAKLGTRLKVGISWTGGYVKTRKDYRSIDLDKWAPILKQDCDFISLQYTPDAYEAIAEIEDKFDIRVHHWPSAVQNPDYTETAALIENLDLIISVNTAAIHLSGALGKECWVLTPAAKAWRYWHDGSGKMPWYPSNQIYQQKIIRDWDDIINQVAEDLKAMVESTGKHCGDRRDNLRTTKQACCR